MMEIEKSIAVFHARNIMSINKKYILSPCGTSLLTNQVQSNEERKIIFKYANTKNIDEIEEAEKVQLQQLISKISKMLETAETQDASRMSAEINGIVKLYKGLIPQNNDFHLLLSTDTWLGEETATLVEQWLKSWNKNIVTEVYRHTDLQTKDLAAFQLSLSELIKKFSEEIPCYSKKGYKIIFNLTGGFKSVQGFLQSIANFFADETVYIFESSSELMKIPRLPIRMDAISIVEDNIDYLRNITINQSTSVPNTIPETLLFSLDGQTILSPWGELIWTSSKSEIYKKTLLASPRPEKIRYGEGFIKTTESLSADRLELINNRIDQLNRYLADTKYNPKSLDFKQLKGNAMKMSTHEINAWSDLDAKRIFGHFEGGVFVLDKLDKGLH